MASLTSKNINAYSCNEIHDPWDVWWRNLWSIEPKGQYNENYPFSSVYFQALMETPFYDEQCDPYDKKIFDLFLAIEIDDKDLLDERFAEFSGGDEKNTRIVLKAGLILAKDLQLETIVDYIKDKLKKQNVPFERLDKKENL